MSKTVTPNWVWGSRRRRRAAGRCGHNVTSMGRPRGSCGPKWPCPSPHPHLPGGHQTAWGAGSRRQGEPRPQQAQPGEPSDSVPASEDAGRGASWVGRGQPPSGPRWRVWPLGTLSAHPGVRWHAPRGSPQGPHRPSQELGPPPDHSCTAQPATPGEVGCLGSCARRARTLGTLILPTARTSAALKGHRTPALLVTSSAASGGPGASVSPHIQWGGDSHLRASLGQPRGCVAQARRCASLSWVPRVGWTREPGTRCANACWAVGEVPAWPPPPLSPPVSLPGSWCVARRRLTTCVLHALRAGHPCPTLTSTEAAETQTGSETCPRPHSLCSQQGARLGRLSPSLQPSPGRVSPRHRKPGRCLQKPRRGSGNGDFPTAPHCGCRGRAPLPLTRGAVLSLSQELVGDLQGQTLLDVTAAWWSAVLVAPSPLLG